MYVLSVLLFIESHLPSFTMRCHLRDLKPLQATLCSKTFSSSRCLKLLHKHVPIYSMSIFHTAAHAGQEQRCLWAERAHTLWTMVMGGKCQCICPCPLPILPSGASSFLLLSFFAFPWGFWRLLEPFAHTEMKSHTVYCSSELTAP